MSTIGTFTRKGNGYIGTVETITFTAETRFVAIDTESRKGPDFRIIAGNADYAARPGSSGPIRATTTSR